MAEIRTRRLGRTGLLVPELGLGAMDTPQSAEGLETLRAAHDLGVRFIDTARGYTGSEALIGQFIRERGGSEFVISSKTFSHTIDGSQRDVDRSLTVMGVESIDLYQLHDIRGDDAWRDAMAEDGALAGLKIAQYRGLIRQIGISSHNLELVERAIVCGEFDAVMLEYSAFFPDTARLIDLAAEHDVGVIVMRPLGGSGRMSALRGRIKDGYQGPLTPSNLLRYVLSNAGVSVAIPGARYPSRISENVSTATSYVPMTEAERREIEAEAASLY
jgi:aryl-alcohol dehydrogenase-like predicted oxidoreductase